MYLEPYFVTQSCKAGGICVLSHAMGKTGELHGKIYIHTTKQLACLITDGTQESLVVSKNLDRGGEGVIGLLFLVENHQWSIPGFSRWPHVGSSSDGVKSTSGEAVVIRDSLRMEPDSRVTMMTGGRQRRWQAPGCRSRHSHKPVNLPLATFNPSRLYQRGRLYRRWSMS